MTTVSQVSCQPCVAQGFHSRLLRHFAPSPRTALHNIPPVTRIVSAYYPVTYDMCTWFSTPSFFALEVSVWVIKPSTITRLSVFCCGRAWESANLPICQSANPATASHLLSVHYCSLHYTTPHYITLHYTTLHYTTLHCTTLLYTTLHYTTLHYYILTLLSQWPGEGSRVGSIDVGRDEG